MHCSQLLSSQGMTHTCSHFSKTRQRSQGRKVRLMGLKKSPSRSLWQMLAVILFVCPSFLEATENVTESGGEDRLQNRAATGENEWIHVGCVSEMEGDKTELTQLNNIESHCKAHCKGKRSQFAGVQRNLCRCGNPAGRLYENANQCNQPHRWKFFALKGKYLSRQNGDCFMMIYKVHWASVWMKPIGIGWRSVKEARSSTGEHASMLVKQMTAHWPMFRSYM